MKERQLICTTESVRGILDRRKTLTRRIVKPQPDDCDERGPYIVRALPPVDCGTGDVLTYNSRIKCPYEVGMHLWVRESWYPAYKRTEGTTGCIYKADYGYRRDLVGSYTPGAGWTSPILMPRWASRITLAVVDVRCERLQDITEADCIAEGVTYHDGAYNDLRCTGAGKWVNERGNGFDTGVAGYRGAFRSAWDTLHGKKHPWSSNCWVWRIAFSVLEVRP